MTLRIFEDTNDNEAVVALHGWLSAAEVEELTKAVAGKVPSLRIDLGLLAGVDSAGLRALRQLRARGARLIGASPYVELLLDRSAPDDDVVR